MNFSLYIARRYLVAKKSHHIINIITAISVAGVTVGTMALIIILSVFNGFEQLTLSLFSTFSPDLVIRPAEGKTFRISEFPTGEIRRVPGVLTLQEYIEENALLKYKDRQYIATVKGVDERFGRMSGLDTVVREGRFMLTDGNKDFCVMGYGVAASLGASLGDYRDPVSIFVPRREAGFSTPLGNAFNTEAIFPSGFISIQQDFDVKYVLVPFRFMKKVMEYGDEVTGIEVMLASAADRDKVQQAIREIAGSGYTVKNRFEQQPLLYKVMQSEKWAIFLILAFILFIATFNVIGSLSMLIIDKKRDISILKSLGAGLPLIKRIFLAEGILITVAGALSGLVLGAVICWLQQQFGLIRMGGAESTFVVTHYPVVMKPLDFLFVSGTVLLIGLLAAWYPVYNIRKIDAMIRKEE